MTKKILFAIIACAACVTLAAGQVFSAGEKVPVPEQKGTPEYPAAVAYDDYEAKAAICESNPVDETFISSLNDFAAKSSSKVLRRQSENYTYSPISAYMALSLATVGSNGDTQQELLKALGIDSKKGVSYLAAQNANLFRRMYLDNDMGKLKIANSLWLSDDMTFNQNYLDTATGQFYAFLFNVDFADKKTGELMGQWIAENTNGTLAPKMEVDKELCMSIINTVYFKDQWVNKFNETATKKDTFYKADGSTVQCDFMNQVFSSHGFVKGKNYTAASLGLKNGGAMNFILPDKGVKTDDLLLTADKASDLLSGGEPKSGMVTFKLPKFNFNTDIDLGGALKSLGVKKAFKETANFSGISSDKGLYISEVKQQTHVAIDENGVEASAFTEIGMAGSALPVDRAEMILDRPFIFTITDRNGVVMFMGVINDPTQK